MRFKMHRDISFEGIAPFDFSISYSEAEKKSHVIGIDSHMHDKCEIYINLTGDISFMVENEIYKVKRGDAIITRPTEYHHCIYDSEAKHKHFWILFSGEGNERFLEKFYEREHGKMNLICPPEGAAEELIEICFKLAEGNLRKSEEYISFFRIIEILSESRAEKGSDELLPQPVKNAIEYLNANIKENIAIEDMAKSAQVSVKTLERYFAKGLKMSPRDFIRYKRINIGAEELRNGATVTEAAMASGFCDTSYFIMVFKKYYSMTPLEYKKKTEKRV